MPHRWPHHHVTKSLFPTGLFTQYIMSTMELRGILRGEKQFEETEQASEPESARAGMLELNQTRDYQTDKQ